MSHSPQQHVPAAYAAVATAKSAKPTSSFFMVASSFRQRLQLYTSRPQSGDLLATSASAVRHSAQQFDRSSRRIDRSTWL